MGAWGTRIYEDDTAMDIRGDFREQLQAGKSVREIEGAVRSEYIEDGADNEYYNDVAILALCCAELETGTLSNETKQDTLEIIESGRQYKYWVEEAGDKADAGRRSHELTLIKKYIAGYTGEPIKRKSWVEMQRDDDDVSSTQKEAKAEPGIVTVGEKLDDADWHMQEDQDVDDDTYLARCGAHIATFIYWLIKRDYFVPMEAADIEEIKKVKTGKLALHKFLDEMLDQKLFIDSVKPELRPFVSAYYAINESRHPVYFNDYINTVTRERKEYSFIPSKAENEEMAKVIDKRLAEYRQAPYQSEPPKQTVRNKLGYQIIWLVVTGSSAMLLYRTGHPILGTISAILAAQILLTWTIWRR